MKIMTVLDQCEDDDSDEGGECDDSHIGINRTKNKEIRLQAELC